MREPARLQKALEFASERFNRIKSEFEEAKERIRQNDDEIRYMKNAVELKDSVMAEVKIQVDNYQSLNEQREEIIRKLQAEAYDYKEYIKTIKEKNR